MYMCLVRSHVKSEYQLLTIRWFDLWCHTRNVYVSNIIITFVKMQKCCHLSPTVTPVVITVNNLVFKWSQFITTKFYLTLCYAKHSFFVIVSSKSFIYWRWTVTCNDVIFTGLSNIFLQPHFWQFTTVKIYYISCSWNNS